MKVTETCHRSQTAENNRLPIWGAAGIIVSQMERVSITGSVTEKFNVLFGKRNLRLPGHSVLTIFRIADDEVSVTPA